MMMFWVTAVLLTAVSTLALLCAAWIRGTGQSDRGAHGLAVYRDQLKELENDHARGHIAAADTDAARTEIQRRILASADELTLAPGPAPLRRTGRLTLSVGMVLLLPAAAFGLYGFLGQPGLPGQPHAARPAPPVGEPGQMQRPEALAELEASLARTPDDPELWARLARTALALRDTTKAVAAFERALALDPHSPLLLTGYGAALTAAAGGTVTPAAENAFEQATAMDPDTAGARFYLGLAALQRGETRTALDIWIALEADSASDSPWLGDLTARIEAAAEASDAVPDLLRSVERLRRGTADAEDPRLPEVITMYEARHDGDGGDAESWRLLGQAYRILGRRQRMVAAFRQAAKLAGDDVGHLLAIAESLYAEPDAPMVFRDVVGRLVTLVPDQPQVQYFAGIIAAADGDHAAARRYFEAIIARLPPDTQLHRLLLQQLDDLPAANRTEQSVR